MEERKQKQMGRGTKDRERYLCLGSMYDIFCIDLKKTEDSNKKVNCRVLTDTPAEAVIIWQRNVFDVDLPLGMTSFESESGGICLIGGELRSEVSKFRSMIGGSNEIYEVILSPKGNGDNVCIKPADSTIPRMKSGKANPIVEEIDRNLYVLHTRYLCRDICTVPEPSFEVFDSGTGKWSSLDTPSFFESPFFNDGSGNVTERWRPGGPGAITIVAHCVLGHRLIVETSKKHIYCFDTHTKKWSYSATMTDNLTNCLPIKVLPLPPFATDKYGTDFFVGITILREPAAFLISADGRCLAKQVLPQVFRNMLPHPARPICELALIPLQPDEEGVVRFCACACVSNASCGPVLLVSIFSAMINPISQNRIKKLWMSKDHPNVDDHAFTNFLNVLVERKFVLKLPGIEDFFSITGPAFFF